MSPSASTIWPDSCKNTNRLTEAEPLMRRAVEIHLELARCKHPHSHYMPTLGNYASLLVSMGRSIDEARIMLEELHGRYGLSMRAPKPAFPSSKRPGVMEKDERDAFVGSQVPEERHPGSAKRVSPVKDLAISFVLILSAVWGPTFSPWFWILSVPLLLLSIFHLALSIPQVRKWFQSKHDEAKR